MTAETDIAAITDGGANTALKVRTALTSVLGRADAGAGAFIDSATTLTLLKGDGITFTANETKTVLDIVAGGAVFYGGMILGGIAVAPKITVDGVVVMDGITGPDGTRGHTAPATPPGVEIFFSIIPPISAGTSLKIEIKNVSGSSRVIGYQGWYST